MNETASLVIKVSSDQVPKAENELDNLAKTAARTERATDGLTATFKRLIGPLVGVAAAGAALRKIVDVTKSFQSLEAQLKTATGSAEDAAIAMQALTDFATQTPYALEQSVGAFIQLTNLGLTPSERALRAYGDTAAAAGKQLSEMANAVGRAVSGEFDPLKSFGVSAKKNGDQITLSFRGVTETVGNSAEEIENYFIRLGEANFAGAMAERMNTLEGAISNFNDSLDQTVYAFSKASGAGALATEAFKMATEGLDNFKASLESGEFNARMDALIFKFRGIGEEALKTKEILSQAFGKELSLLGQTAIEVGQKILDAFKYLPENVLSLVQGIGAGLGLFVAYGEAAANGVLNVFNELWQGVVSSFSNVGKEIKDTFLSIFVGLGKQIREFQIATAEALNKILPERNQYGEDFFKPLREDVARFDKTLKEVDFDFVSEQAKTLANTFGSVKGAARGVITDMDAATGRFNEVVSGIATQNEVAKKSFDDLSGKATKLREEYEKEQGILKALTAFFGDDRTARFVKRGGDDKGLSDSKKKEFENLRQYLLDEEQLFAESYDKRADLILENESLTAEQRFSLLAALNSRAIIEEDRAYQDKAARLEAQYMAEQVFLQDALDKRLISEQEFQERSKANWSNYTGAITKTVVGGTQIIAMKQMQMHSQVLSLASDITSQLAALAGENTAAAKAMFVASKAIAIAQAIVNTEMAATRALAEGGLYLGIPMASVIRGLGYASIGIMAGTAVAEFQGKFEKGGMISAGKYGITDEAGYEIKRGPMQVTSAATTRDALRSSMGGGSTSIEVSVINQTGIEVEAEQQPRGDGGFDLILKRIRSGVAADIRSGDNEISRSLESTFGVRRSSGAR